MLKTISPIDNSVYLERPYASSSEIENVLKQSNQSKIVWKNTSLVERKELTSGSTWHAAGLLPFFNMSYSWGWKDPRNIFTLPFWINLFPSSENFTFPLSIVKDTLRSSP